MSTDASKIEGCTPAHRVVSMLGGVKRAAALANGSVQSVYRWMQPANKGGCGGLVPMPAQRRMVRNAPAAGIALAFEDFAPKPGEVVL